MERGGVRPLSSEEGLALLDLSLTTPDALLVPVRFDARVFATAAEQLPAIMRALGRRRLRRAAELSASSSLQARLSTLGAAERERVLLEAIVGVVSTVLGVAAWKVERDLPLSDLGLDSLMAVEIRNHLTALSGVRLSSTLLFDHPTPNAITRYLNVQLSGDTASAVVRASKATLATSEPIAIIGISCRLPGGADSPEALWQRLVEGRDLIGDFPTDRGWDAEALYDPDPDASGKTTTCKGGFLRDAAGFDPAFFGISPREALAADPQQRLLLEVAWEALERAAIDPSSLQGSSSGVFVGLYQNNYSLLGVPPELEGFAMTGGANSVASGRIAYTLGLQGPTLTVDTACSSSLMAVHLACQSLRQGECELALAGGATVMATPNAFVEFSRQRGLAADGRSKSFADGADGVGFSEGAAMLVLARLSDARRSGRPLLALVRGSATNQDGKSQGLTAPNGPAQEQVIRQALANARLSSIDIDAVEAHGTGTPLGDPIEAQALIATYGAERPADRPLWLGSLKSNLGHTQAAAGAAGMVKMVLALQHELLPKSLHSELPTHHVDWSDGTVQLLHAALPWKTNGRPRRAAVSSFGISGTNVHVILEEAPAEPIAAQPEVAAAAVELLPFVVSGRSQAALRAQAEQLRSHLLAHPELALHDVAYSLSTARASFESRAVVVAEQPAQLLEELRALSQSQASAATALGQAKVSGKLVFVFPGQGSQWIGMAKELMASSEVFARQMQACADALAPHVEWSLLEVLAAEDGAALERVDVVQPVLFAMMVSLAALWRSKGIEPDAVVGHSQGEIAAAYVAGALSLQDAARIAALRARALMRLTGLGGMAAVELSAEQLSEYLDRFEGRLSIAAINGPSATVVTGELAALEELLAELSRAEILARRVRSSIPGHCALTEQSKDELLEVLARIEPKPTQIPMFSTVQPEFVEGERLDADYWYRNARQTVRFSEAVLGLLSSGHHHFVEISAHPALTQALQSIAELAKEPLAAVGTLRRDQGNLRRFMLSMGELHAQGYRVDWTHVLTRGRTVSLPTYAFQRDRYWLDDQVSGSASDVSSAGLTAAEHPLLGASVTLADGEGVLFTGCLSLQRHKWLRGHAVFGTTLFPGTAFVELALTAAQRVGLFALDELILEAPLSLPERGGVQIQLSVGALEESGMRPVAIYSRREDAGADGAWTRNASGTLRPASLDDSQLRAAREEFRSWPPAGATKLELDGLYAAMAGAGVAYTDAFCGLRAAYRRGDELFAEVKLPESAGKEAARYGLHPALLDAALHVLALREPGSGVALPFAWQGVNLLVAGATALRVRVAVNEASDTSLLLADETGQIVGQIDALRTRPASERQVRGTAAVDEALFRVEWSQVPAADGGAKSWALLGGEGLTGTGGFADAQLRYADFEALRSAIAAGAAVPDVVVWPCFAQPLENVLGSAHTASHRALELLQHWVANEQLAGSRLLVLTRGAVAAGTRDRVRDLAHAPLWGLVRAARAERSDADLRLLDLDDSDESGPTPELVAQALAADETQLAVRDGLLCAPRLSRNRADMALPQGTAAWSLQVETPGTLDGLAPLPYEQPALTPNAVRVAVRAAGMNFRDVLVTLGMYPEEGALIGSDAAGVVVEVGSDVTDLKPGDRVMGVLSRTFGPTVIAERRTLVPIPTCLSFVQAASVPTVYLTAIYGLVDLARLRAGERVLVHAAAGGVGIAAVQLARHLGAEVFATASPAKWDTLRALGIPDDHIASSRTLEFEQRFRAVTGGEGVDVVLDSLSGDFVDASLRLLKRGGRFLEMGRTDVRDAAAVEAEYGVSYRAYLLGEASFDRLQEMLRQSKEFFECGAFSPQPVTTWDIRRAPEAFRYMAQAKHVGKLVLTFPQLLSPEGTVLITGGTGTLGGLVAERLVTEHGARHLLLCSRSGRADALQAQLQTLGASVTVAACDVSQRAEVEALLASIPAQHPLTAVIHTAATLDDGVVEAQSPERIDRVFGAKLDGAWHLHELTRELDLQAFVMFSSVAGVLGAPGQSNYAAANAFLDALAQYRRAQGLPAVSLAWGYWEQRSALTARLDQTDLARIARGGIRPLSTADALSLLDAALAVSDAQLVPVRFEARLFAMSAEELPPMLRSLGRRRLRRSGEASVGASSLKEQLLPLSAADRERRLLDIIVAAVSTVMGVPASKVELDRPLRELGLDSLMAVELRNHLARQSGLRLPSTLLFDQPTANALCGYLEAKLLGEHRAVLAVPAVSRRTPLETGDPTVIVGMSCRYPGGADSPEALWVLLLKEADAMGDFPSDRGWDAEALLDPDPDAPGKTSVCKGGFVRDVAEFDPGFFGISPREALAMDPQHRLLLETTWEALESACVDPSSLQGSSTGVFVGLFGSDYIRSGLPAELEGHAMTGGSNSVASGRIAYSLGLRGPAITVDTACSSSLVALHLACQSLQQGECDLALTGGVTVMATAGTFVGFSRQRGLALDGRCKPFSDSADGTAFSEGVGILVLERLADARRNQHPVLAVVRGSAINQDGRSQGLTAPNGPAQEQVIRQALANARLSSSEIDAVEAHGTGTTLGDPIEAHALLATYGAERGEEHPLWLGSLKSNVGHTQAAAGVGGVIKLVLALQHELLPKSLHADVPTRHVDWSAGTVKLLHEALPWKQSVRPRRAGISAFGISGTNAHVILEESPAPSVDVVAHAVAVAAGPWPFVVSGRGAGALRAQAGRLLSHLQAHPDLRLLDVAHSLAATRASFEARAVVVAAERTELLEQLLAVSEGRKTVSTAVGHAKVSGKLVFVFPGQGSQWLGMAKELIHTSEVFAQQLQACARVLAPHVDWSLLQVLTDDDAAPLERVDVVQPVLFSVMVSLAALWRSQGIEPDAVVGHSQGEIAAAYVAGALSLADAARVVALRAHALTRLSGRGGMAAVELPAAELSKLLARYDGRLSIAAINSPSATVVSGESQALDALLAELAQREILGRRIAVDYASHCAQLEEIKHDLLAALSDIAPGPSRIPLYSTLHAELVDGETLDAAYWYENGRSTVRFSEAVQNLLADGHAYFVEVSAHPVLTQAVQNTADAAKKSVAVVGTLRREQGGLNRFLVSLGELHTHGRAIDWSQVIVGGHKVPLPTYAFQNESYWVEQHAPALSGDVASLGQVAAEHPMLGASVTLAGGDGLVFTGRLSLAQHKWLSGHVVFGTTILPGTGFVELALAAAQRVGLSDIEELTLEAPLVIPERGGVQIQLAVGPLDELGTRTLTVFSRREDRGADAVWTRHASGTLGSQTHAVVEDLRSWPPDGAQPVALDGLYEALSALGLTYHGAFQGLRAAYRRGDELFAEVELPEKNRKEAEHYALHPALFDAALHVLVLQGEQAEVALPFAWRGVSLHAAGASVLRVKARVVDSEISLLLADAAGGLVGQVAALRTRSASAAQLRAGEESSDSLYQVTWVTAAPVERSDVQWAFLGDAETDSLAQSSGASASYADIAALSSALDAGTPVPDIIVLSCSMPGTENVLTTAHTAAHRVLQLLQAWFADERLAARELVVLTRGAVAAGPDDAVSGLAHAPLWGLLRTAQSEHADRAIRLLDVDRAVGLDAALLAAALASHEPQLALRAGVLCVPRLTRRVPERKSPGEPLEGEAQQPSRAKPLDLTHGTVLITGGTGTLGALVAEHLVSRHGVRHLLLCSRTGRADALQAHLEAQGVSVTVAACDIAQRSEVETLLASIPEQQPLAAIIHTAAVLDDGVLSAQSAERLDRVFAPKLDGAWHLHELTRELDLQAFVLFSSLAGIVGSAGQSNYAAANTFLDALAQYRRSQGLAGTSLAWGYWAQQSGMTSHLGEADLARIARGGLRPLSSEEALSHLDVALNTTQAQLAPVGFDTRVFATSSQQLPAIMRALVRSRLPRAVTASASSFKARLAALSADEREQAVLDAVVTAVTAVMGVAAAKVETDVPLRDLGLDSLMAVELRTYLAALTELRLPSTLVFDYPTPSALATLLHQKLIGTLKPERVESDKSIHDAIRSISIKRLRDAGVLDVLLRLARAQNDTPDETTVSNQLDRLESMSAEELIQLVEEGN
jgi:acyl transferase domain-containing protein/D-arabinose 1-dehydrogenase-like Zn-dependent alcohol dehydrogenase/acyl carrier protein